MLERLGELGLGVEDLAAWQAAGLPPDAFDDWLVDRLLDVGCGGGLPLRDAMNVDGGQLLSAIA